MASVLGHLKGRGWGLISNYHHKVGFDLFLNNSMLIKVQVEQIFTCLSEFVGYLKRLFPKCTLETSAD